MDRYITVADAKILCCFANLVTEAAALDDDQLHSIFGTFGTLLSRNKSQISFSSLENITAVLVYYSSPLSLSLQDVVYLGRELYESVHGEVSVDPETENFEESNDIEEFAQYIAGITDNIALNDGEWIVMAGEIVNELNLKAQGQDMAFEESSLWTYLFDILKQRLYLNSVYIDNIEISEVLIQFMWSSELFKVWYTGFYKPYRYYWDNYASISDSHSSMIRYHEYSTIKNSFDALIEPINGTSYSERVEPVVWLDNVIIPVLKWKDYDFEPLNDWMFNQTGSSSSKQKLWNGVLGALIKASLPFDTISIIISNYLINCYFDTIYDYHVTSLEMSRVFDLMRETFLELIPIVPGDVTSIIDDISFDKEIIFNTLEEFRENTTLKPLLIPTKQNMIFFSEMISVCSKLFPINQLDVPTFLQLKYSASTDDSKREVSKIISGLTSTNSSKLLGLLDVFKTTFVVDEAENEAVDTLVIDRFLFNNLFDIITRLHDEQKLGVDSEIMYGLLTKKFWDSTNNATNFDERVGKLSYAANCLLLFDKLNLTSSQRAETSKLKHLMKVFTNIRNFKLQTRTSSLTPSEVIKKYGSLPSNEELRTEMESTSPMGLITIILEQNPKSYLAFEKLFKVLHDFLIFLEDHNTNTNTNYYLQRFSSACIEASLIDNNFNYAYKKAVDLLDQYDVKRSGNLNNMWMTFYQVGNFHSPDWLDSLESTRVEVLVKQSEILARYLKVIDRSDVSVDNSRIIVDQWNKVNQNIDQWYSEVETVQKQNSKLSTRQLQENITNTANDILNDAANTTNQASEKLSNLFVSGLGWAIGANKS